MNIYILEKGELADSMTVIGVYRSLDEAIAASEVPADKWSGGEAVDRTGIFPGHFRYWQACYWKAWDYSIEEWPLQ